MRTIFLVAASDPLLVIFTVGFITGFAIAVIKDIIKYYIKK